MSLSLIVSGAGAVVVAIGLVMLLARCLRTPRGDLIAWSVALAGLLVSLGAQAAGHLLGFTGVTFRAMEAGAAAVAPLALIMGLSEAVARSMVGRFAGRLLIPAFAVTPLVIFAIDPLSSTAFTKAWPDPVTYYELVPNWTLEYVLAPVTIVVAVVTVAIAIRRSRHEFAWRAALLPVTAAGLAVLVLALPGLAPPIRDHLGVRLPLSSAFALLCLLAGVLAWYAGVGITSVPGDALRDAGLRSGGGGDPGRYPRYEDGPYDGRPYEAGSYDSASFDSGAYDSGAYDRLPGGPVPGGAVPGGPVPGGPVPGDAVPGDAAPGAPARAPDAGRPVAVDQTGDMEAYRDDGYGRPRAEPEPGGYGGPRTGDYMAATAAAPPPSSDAAAGLAADEGRDHLFGQIAIYTLIEDQVAEFDRLTERVVARVRSSEPSTLVYIVHAVPSAPMQRILYEVYRDRAAYDWHLQQPYVSQFEADRRPYVLATNVIELGLQHAKVSPFPSITDLFGEPGHDTSGFERPDFTREYGSTTGASPAAGPPRGGHHRVGDADPAAGR